MLKRLWIGLAAAAISISASVTVFAGEWRQNDAGWWYDFGDAAYAKDGWHWVDGKCYYFTPDGYCLQNTTTPDGYTVDASGAWTIDGVVQVQDSGAGSQAVNGGAVYQVGNFIYTMPADYVLMGLDDFVWNFVRNDERVVLTMCSSALDISDEKAADESFINEWLDFNMMNVYGVWDSRETVELVSGRWRAYKYSDSDTGFLEKAYMRVKNHCLEQIIVGSLDANMDKDGFLNQCIR